MAALKFNEKRQRWVIRYYDHTGERGWETMPKGTSSKDAKRRRREIEDCIEKKTFRRPTQIPTFGEVANQWLEARSSSVRSSTLAQYTGHIENHLNPFFGNVKCSEVDLDLVERFVSHKTNESMFPNTLQKVITTLGGIMRYASHPKRNYAPYDPTIHIENKPKKIKREAEMATQEEIAAIVNQMDQEKDRLIVLTMAIGGMREGEVFGLQWGDIQWKDAQVYVRRTFTHRRFYEPKTAKSRRVIDVPDELLHELKRWKLACPNSELDLVFPTRRGTPIIATNWLKRNWHPARRRAGVRSLTPHSLRHFSGSFLLDQGEDMGYVQDHLGHSDIGMTMNVYRHKIKKQNREAAEKLGRAFFGPNGCKKGANEV